MLSFRVGDAEAAEVQHWAQELGLDRSELLRQAVHRYLVALRSELDAERWEQLPASDAERSLTAIAAWGPAETGPTGPMQRGEVWFTATPGGDRPVLVLTRDPVADRIDSVVVAALTRTKRHLVSELDLTAVEDQLPSDCVVNFDNLHTIPLGVSSSRRAAVSVAHGPGVPDTVRRRRVLRTR